MTGADLLVRLLKAQDVPFVLTLCGNGLDPLYAACKRQGLRLVDVRNEQAAGYMADAVGRLTAPRGGLHVVERGRPSQCPDRRRQRLFRRIPDAPDHGGERESDGRHGQFPGSGPRGDGPPRVQAGPAR